MIITQAILGDMTIVTHDKMIQSYAVSCMMV